MNVVQCLSLEQENKKQSAQGILDALRDRFMVGRANLIQGKVFQNWRR